MPNLVGIGNSQVPTNAMLGGLAYQDPAYANLTSVEIENIAAIKAKLNDTATDIFVYDTRKDSDGGAWRHRTQNTSWYNETVGAYRGARKEFPAVAVIVVSSSALTIYDADDPNMSMWMIFVNDNAKWLKHTTSGPKSVVAMNGIVVSCGAGGAGRLSVVNFVSDDGYVTEAGYTYRHEVISTRNSTSVGPTDGGTRSIVNNDCNDVAMTVLPNAPIDDSTGLPIPTIAVATAGGVSVIKDNGFVVDMYPTGSSVTPAKEIYFTKSNKLAFTHGGNWVYYYPISSSDVTATYWNSLPYFIGRFTDTERDWATNGIPINVGANGITNFLEDRAIGHTNGLDLIDINEGGLLGSGMHCGIATNFNTGWQHGDIKGAWLADTDDTNITGSEMVTNGTFDSNIDDWTYSGTGGHSYSSGTIEVTGAVGNISYQDISGLVVGEKYILSGDIVGGTNGQISIYANALASSGGIIVGTGNIVQSHSNLVFTATTTTVNLRLVRVSSTVKYDNISLYKVGSLDRSIKGAAKTYSEGAEALKPVGTIEKHAVADGAELVSYRADSSSEGTNYLTMRLTSGRFDLTSDWSINFWAKNNGNTGTNYSGFEISPDDITGNAAYGSIPFSMYIQPDGVLGLRGTSVTAMDAQSPLTAPLVTQDDWRCFNIISKSGRLYLYIDGELNGSTVATFANPGVNYSLNIFRWSYGTSRYDGRRHIDFSLFRMSNSSPSPEQVKKMYDDEKKLFTENAKCTLHGTSDAVTATEFDDTNDVLHVGTSSGRSDFVGLTRINNTTTAVTTAISASNRLVAEQ